MSGNPMTPIALANYLLKLAEGNGVEDMTPLKLTKLVYLCHGWYMGVFGDPLVDEEVKAWEKGPAFISIYEAVKGGGNSPVSYPVNGDITRPHKQQKELIDQVFDSYKHLDGDKMSERTHQPGSPWSLVWKRFPDVNATIPNGLIRKYYEMKANVSKN